LILSSKIAGGLSLVAVFAPILFFIGILIGINKYQKL